jgi:hypothetical protein
MIRTLATPVNALVGPATHRHVRSRQPHRKVIAGAREMEKGHSSCAAECPLSGVKRTWSIAVQMSAYDPKRTFRAYYRRSIELAKSHNAVAANNKTKLALTIV